MLRRVSILVSRSGYNIPIALDAEDMLMQWNFARIVIHVFLGPTSARLRAAVFKFEKKIKNAVHLLIYKRISCAKRYRSRSYFCKIARNTLRSQRKKLRNYTSAEGVFLSITYPYSYVFSFVVCVAHFRPCDGTLRRLIFHVEIF